jgi:hypothetical protein
MTCGTQLLPLSALLNAALCSAGESCEEFKPEWEAVSSTLKRVKTAHVLIDSKHGNALASKLGECSSAQCSPSSINV